MSWFDALSQSARRVIAKLRQWVGAKTRRGPRLRHEHVEYFPDSLKSATVYVAGEEPHLWAAALLCPCGCGEVIHLNLLEDTSPSWKVRKNRDGSITVMPSIWRTKGCHSHFFIRNGHVDWCRLDNRSSSIRT